MAGGRSQRHRLNLQGVRSSGHIHPLRREATKVVPGRTIPGVGPAQPDQKTTSVAGAPVVAYAAGPTNLTPTSASVSRTASVGTNVGTVMTPTGGTAPYTYSVVNAAGCAVDFTANQLKTTANPVHATTGAKTLTLAVQDANSKMFSITYTLTLS